MSDSQIRNLEVDVPVEVTKQQYDYIMNHCPGACFGRWDVQENKYYIKLASNSYKSLIKRILKS